MAKLLKQYNPNCGEYKQFSGCTPSGKTDNA